MNLTTLLRATLTLTLAFALTACTQLIPSSLRTSNVNDVARFHGVGDLFGGLVRSNAWGVSGDGSVVVGRSDSVNGLRAFRWVEGGSGMTSLSELPGGSSFSQALGVSGDGSVIVGNSDSANGNEAFRWFQPGGMVGLGDLPGAGFSSQAWDASGDGSVIVGGGKVGIDPEAFRWTEASGMVGLGTLPGGQFSSARGVSDDGSVVVGVNNASPGLEAFRWTEADGMVGLGDLPGGVVSSEAFGVSGDGSVIVGSSHSSNGTEAFRWTEAEGMVGLGSLPSGLLSIEARAASGDGTVIVGQGEDGNQQLLAFVWDDTLGLLNLKDALEAEGLDLTGWTLTAALDVSDDGSVIVGAGINPSGNPEGFRAVLPRLTPQERIDLLIEKIEMSDLKSGQKNGLIRPLENALRSLDRDIPKAACSQLSDFIDGVNAKTPTPIDEATANEWIDDAMRILDEIGCD